MKRILPRSGRVVAAAVAALALSTTVSGTAHAAAAVAYLERPVHLYADSADGPSYEMTRSILLDSGYYHWEYEVISHDGSTYWPTIQTRDIYLAGGWYLWTCTEWEHDEGYYDATCTLDPAKAGYKTATLPAAYDYYVLTSGYFTMHSELVPK